jgi:hypothetical protein
MSPIEGKSFEQPVRCGRNLFAWSLSARTALPGLRVAEYPSRILCNCQELKIAMQTALACARLRRLGKFQRVATRNGRSAQGSGPLHPPSPAGRLNVAVDDTQKSARAHSCSHAS